ncbi:hypothetical protein Tco_1110543 [Tanacetum coccineum]|uniref:Uncharacterized protein n=1 Tax=Tanacetum coccineum TaxID=301880 RepID=A0ABQ5IKI9_9ASTR
MKSNPQDQAAHPALYDVLKCMFEKSSTSTTSCRDDAFRPHHHDDHQEDDAPPEEEKRTKRHMTSKSSKSLKSTRSSSSKMMATLNDVMSNQFKDAEEDNPEEYFSNHRITEVVRITTDQQHRLDYMKQIIVMRENDKTDSFSETDFKYINKNDIEDLYYLCLNKKVNFCEIKLMNSLITFIRSSHDPYYIVDKPSTGLIYLNRKEKKRVIYLAEIVKFWDATLERVLNEVKLKIFKFEPWKKPPLLGELDLDILKACEREITKRLRHRVQMRRWESNTIQKHLFGGTGLFKINKICHGVSSERK